MENYSGLNGKHFSKALYVQGCCVPGLPMASSPLPTRNSTAALENLRGKLPYLVPLLDTCLGGSAVPSATPKERYYRDLVSLAWRTLTSVAEAGCVI